ncbi:MAG: ferredoxin [Patescibacteria group bacterium]
MSITINNNLCIGCGTCEALCPNIFKINQQGKSEIISQTNSACAKNAVKSCPAQAIAIS